MSATCLGCNNFEFEFVCINFKPLNKAEMLFLKKNHARCKKTQKTTLRTENYNLTTKQATLL